MNNITGLCECGCGQQTRIATKTDPRCGWVKGLPLRFILGHSSKLQRLPVTKGYRRISVNGYLKYLHVIRAEAALGKPLPPKAEVHHADGSMNDDAPLVICEDRAYHFLLHARMRVKRAGGNPNIESFCRCCRTIKPHEAFGVDRERFNRLSYCCRTCNNAKEKQKRDRKKMEQQQT